jgi:hypothetical protein|nr:MAG TPA: hypothetical protein [Caudoviricetes sp.]
MILRLNGADFSANNIGKIDIIREITSDTKKLLSNFSREFTDEQMFAVQDFISGLKNNGIWSSIGNLYIPVMCGSLSECGYNLKTGEKDVVFGSDYVWSNKGLKLLPTSTNYWATAAKVKINGSQQNLHLGAYNTDSLAGITQTEAIYGCSLTDDNKTTVQLGITANKYFSLKTDNNTDVSVGSLTNADFGKQSLKMVIQSTLGNFGVIGNFTGEYNTPISTDHTYTDVPVNVFNIAAVWRETKNYGLLTLGTAMTREQASTYSSLCDTLMSKFITN